EEVDAAAVAGPDVAGDGGVADDQVAVGRHADAGARVVHAAGDGVVADDHPVQRDVLVAGEDAAAVGGGQGPGGGPAVLDDHPRERHGADGGRVVEVEDAAGGVAVDGQRRHRARGAGPGDGQVVGDGQLAGRQGDGPRGGEEGGV